MGYYTDFEGGFRISPILTLKDRTFLNKFSETRRVARALGNVYGVEGEFYVEGNTVDGPPEDDINILDYNRPPFTQPGLWCSWRPSQDGEFIVWDGGEKFYNYVPWIKYLIDSILSPRGYTLNGEVHWTGEDNNDVGVIFVRNNKVSFATGKVVYEKEQEA